jgi:hypothetical protein
MAPTKTELVIEIENLKEIIRQKDQEMQSQKEKVISLYQAMISMNQAMAETLGVSYEPSQLDISTGMYHFLNLVKINLLTVIIYIFFIL